MSEIGAFFLFEGKRVKLEVPSNLSHINKLTIAIAETDGNDKYNEVFESSYDYLVLELADIFGKELGIDGCDLNISFMMPETSEEEAFGSVVLVERV